MKENDNPFNYDLYNGHFENKFGSCSCKDKRMKSECNEEHASCRKHDKGICINNNPVIKICVNGSENGTQTPQPFLSSYMEALGQGQTILANSNIVFDVESIDSVGNNIELDASGTIFTINRAGLYHVEWSLNLAENTASAVVGIIENGEPASGSATVTGGNFSSGTLIQVDTVPFTLSLHNYNNEITTENVAPYEDSAVSIRIVRFADGPSE